jgi:hypothetical protein
MSKNEAKNFRNNPEIQKRVIKSYELMLDFYGMCLVNKKTGLIARNPVCYKNRYKHLNSSFHNYLRITRILKCLGISGIEKYKKQFLKHMVIEIFKNNVLSNCDDSCVKFWIPTLRNEKEIEELDALVFKLGNRKVNREGKGYFKFFFNFFFLIFFF